MTNASTAEILNNESAAAPTQLFVINLCASTSPMALSHPSAPELKRYTFFVSRQREDGRERFRLHMGYFASQQEADAMLNAVRDVYPAAWAGLAPTSGAPRRARTATMPAVKPARIVAAVAPVVAPVAPAAVVRAPAPAPVAAAAIVAAPEPQARVLDSMSNVRDVLAQLSEVAEPKPAAVMAAAAPAPRVETAVALAPPPIVEPPRLLPVAKPGSPPVRAEVPALSNSQTLRVLESAVPASMVGLESDAEVRVVTPEDTQTLTDIRIDVQNNAPPCFAVQLVWSVSPIDIAALPHLAIFDAYTLYNVEGNRQGRKWFGLRLGFFSDPNSATQVANYVRADYRAVAIVPVATKERDSAGGNAAAQKSKAVPRLGEAMAALKPDAKLEVNTESLQGFELLADDRPTPTKRDLDDGPEAAGKTAAKAAVSKKPQGAASKVTGKPGGKRVVVRKRPDAPLSRVAPGSAAPLESTLEILGASTLTLDEGRAIINDSTVRKSVDRKAGNRFSKLLSRLSGS